MSHCEERPLAFSAQGGPAYTSGLQTMLALLKCDTTQDYLAYPQCQESVREDYTWEGSVLLPGNHVLYHTEL